jgi:hypothetical protein
MQVKGKIIKGWVGFPSNLTMEVKEVLVGPQNSGKAEKVALMSMRRERPNFNEVSYPGLHQSSVIVASGLPVCT